MIVKPLAVLDTECYRNYWLCKVRRLDNGAVRAFEQYDGHPLDWQAMDATLRRLTLITFNGKTYDMPMIAFALRGADCENLKRCSDLIIKAGMNPWDVERQFNCKIPDYDHIDMIEVVPGMVSLKVYMGRLHCRKLQDLPIEHDALIAPEQRAILMSYNDNDLDGTGALFYKFRKEIDLRVQMSAQYGVDLRSKSDAQIAEAVIKSELTKITGITPRKPDVRARSFKFRFPAFLKNAGPIIREVIAQIRDADFIVKDDGKVQMPDQLVKAKINIGRASYKMGIGGLHSTEQSVAHVGDDDTFIIDRDVASYYPAIIINTGLFPRHLGQPFLDVYRTIRDRRLAAKHAGDKSTANTLKIVLNGSFGKFGNPWSILYSPDLLIQTTVTGQLALLMLIEMIEAIGVPVVSANTDGIVIKCPRARYDDLGAVISRWEGWTGFETEETRYKALYSRDVNNYIAIKDEGGAKLKGAYAEPEPVASSWPSPHFQICVHAVCDFLEWGFPIETTVRLCTDIRQFIAVRNVTGGAKWNEQYLGRAVRWYMATGNNPAILYVKANAKTGNHASVARTEGCRPLMQMDGTMPDDIDFDWYINEARAILDDIGYTRIQSSDLFKDH